MRLLWHEARRLQREAELSSHKPVAPPPGILPALVRIVEALARHAAREDLEREMAELRQMPGIQSPGVRHRSDS